MSTKRPALHADHDAPDSLLSEGLLTLTQAAKLLPRRKGKGPHTTTVLRWIKKGWQGVKLEAQLSPGGWVTSAPAVERFLRATTTAGVRDEVIVRPRRAREAAIRRAEAECEAAGV